ncbi:MAG: HAD family phosphatase [Chitinophagales bacterium]|nr:HAD family phosphatase [Chitinophagales bacterium]
MKNIDTLIFDLGNVILPLEDESFWWNSIFGELFSNFEEVNKLRNDGLLVQYEKGAITTQEFLDTLKSFLKEKYTEIDIVNRWNALLKEIPHHRIDFLRALKERYKLYLLSNTNEIHLKHFIQESINTYGIDVLDDVFDKCYYSYQIKQVKPDLEIYQTVLNEQNLVAQNCLFIDDKKSNIEGAAQLGIQTHLFSIGEDISVVLKEL